MSGQYRQQNYIKYTAKRFPNYFLHIRIGHPQMKCLLGQYECIFWLRDQHYHIRRFIYLVSIIFQIYDFWYGSLLQGWKILGSESKREEGCPAAKRIPQNVTFQKSFIFLLFCNHQKIRKGKKDKRKGIKRVKQNLWMTPYKYWINYKTCVWK